MVFVTGGTGLLGTHLLLELLSRGYEVRALKRSQSDLKQVESVFHYYLKERANEEFAKIDWIEGDVLDVVSLEQGMKGCDAVYHAAAKVSFLKKDFNEMWKINKEGTENIVNVALSEKVKYLCYMSSTATIGEDLNKEFLDETVKWKKSKDTSNYSITKHSAEMEVWRGIEEGLNAVIVNPSVILGPGNWNESSISIFKVIKKGLRFYPTGANAFVDARDVATIAVELSEREIFNQRFLTISENLRFKQLFDQIAESFNVKPPGLKVKKWMASLAWKIEGLLRVFFGRKQNITRETVKSSMRITKFSNQKIKNELNFEFIRVSEAVQNAVNYFDNRDLNKK